MRDSEEASGEGYLTPSGIYAALDNDFAAAEALRERTDALAEQPAHTRVAGRFLVGLVTAMYEVAEFDHPFFGPVFRGLRGRLAAGGCDLILCGNRPARIGDPL